ncbi:nephrocystin-4 isoform X1 [Tachysurus ichikawai]
MGAEVPSVVVQERRLHVGVHNGLGWVDRPQLMVLEPSSEGSASLKQSSTETNRHAEIHAEALESELGKENIS